MKMTRNREDDFMKVFSDCDSAISGEPSKYTLTIKKAGQEVKFQKNTGDGRRSPSELSIMEECPKPGLSVSPVAMLRNEIRQDILKKGGKFRQQESFSGKA